MGRPCSIILVLTAYYPPAELGNTSSITTTPSPTAAAEASGSHRLGELCKMKWEGHLEEGGLAVAAGLQSHWARLGFEITTTAAIL